MSENRQMEPSKEDVELLLPWFVTGKLDTDEAHLVETYLRDHPAMRSQIALIEAELTGVTTNNEAIGPPSADALTKLMANIGAGSQHAPLLAMLSRRAQAIVDWLNDRSALVPIAAALSVVLLLQAGTISTLLWRSATNPASYHTASAPSTTVSDKATYVLAGFVQTATAQQIEQALQPLGISIVDGPRAGGIYRLRLSEKVLGDTERDILMTALKSNTGVVRFVAPAAP